MTTFSCKPPRTCVKIVTCGNEDRNESFLGYIRLFVSLVVLAALASGCVKSRSECAAIRGQTFNSHVFADRGNIVPGCPSLDFTVQIPSTSIPGGYLSELKDHSVCTDCGQQTCSANLYIQTPDAGMLSTNLDFDSNQSTTNVIFSTAPDGGYGNCVYFVTLSR